MCEIIFDKLKMRTKRKVVVATVKVMGDYTETVVRRSSKEAYLEPSRMSLLELFVEIVNR